MGPQEILELAPAIDPGAIIDNAAFPSNVIDTARAGGAKFLALILHVGTTDVDIASLKVNQSDTKTDDTTLDSPTELADYSASATLPTAADGGKLFGFLIDLRRGDLKRYVQLAATAGDGTNGTYASAIALWFNPGVPAANMGLDGLVEV